MLNPNDRGAVMARQFIYHMQGLSKSYPGNRKVLENINLSFYPDAKIGVLGVNGSGKSTLLRIAGSGEFAADVTGHAACDKSVGACAFTQPTRVFHPSRTL